MRLNKLLARRGVGARRKCDALIQSGVVRVNGAVVTEPGVQVEPERDRITVRGRPLAAAAEHRYFVLNKPVGVITTLEDPEGRRTIRSFMPPGPRLFPVGRLDADTSGLLMLTNDGDLAHHLMHPRYGVEKVYRVRIDRPATAVEISRLREGVEFEPGILSAPARVRPLAAEGGHGVIEIAVHEGRYRQVRRMCEAVGLNVLALHRAAYGPVRLGPIARGMWRELSSEEVERLRRASARPHPRPPLRRARGRARMPGPMQRSNVHEGASRPGRFESDDRSLSRERPRSARPSRPRFERRPRSSRSETSRIESRTDRSPSRSAARFEPRSGRSSRSRPSRISPERGPLRRAGSPGFELPRARSSRPRSFDESPSPSPRRRSGGFGPRPGAPPRSFEKSPSPSPRRRSGRFGPRPGAPPRSFEEGPSPSPRRRSGRFGPRPGARPRSFEEGPSPSPRQRSGRFGPRPGARPRSFEESPRPSARRPAGRFGPQPGTPPRSRNPRMQPGENPRGRARPRTRGPVSRERRPRPRG